MPLPKDQLAHGLTLATAARMSVHEVHLALRASYCDLTDRQFWSRPAADRHNPATIVWHCLQQGDHFNSHLQQLRELPAPHGWQFLEHEERFQLWGLPPEKRPQPNQDFPTVAATLTEHDALVVAMLANLDAVPEALESTPVEQWPKMADMFFRHVWHLQAHTRQLYLLRGLLGLSEPFPVQTHA